MINSAPAFQLLYVSDLTPGASEDAVDAISAVSRQRNLAVGISGALLFDGGRFSQFLEGEASDIDLLMTRIKVDPRHCNVSIRAAGNFGMSRLMTRWRLARCSPHVLDPLVSQPMAPTDEVAIALFLSALTSAQAS